MPPKSKARGKSSGPPVKKAKIETVDEDRTTLEEDTVEWHLEDRPNVWTSFPLSIQKELVKAYNDGLVQCEIEGGEFAVLFEKPCRKTVKSGYMKRVRLALKDTTDGNYYVWCWTDGRKKRRYYDVESTLRLEENQDSDSLDLHTEGKACDVSAKDMLHENKYTMYREMSDAAAAPEPAPNGAGDATPSSKSKAASKMADSIAKSKAVKEEVKEEVLEKKVAFSGKAPVDPECIAKAKTSFVYYEPSCVWDCMLNQTNLQNNNNKYYLIQLLKDNTANVFSVWMRWGRVGKKGQTSLFPCGPDLDEAKDIFSKKFKDKTRNNWADRDSFAKVSGKYDLVAIDYAADDEPAKDDVDAKKPVKVPDSKLDTRLQTLIKLICDVKAMERALVEMKYDAKKAPLGKLTKAQIKAGYEALRQIEDCIKKGKFAFELTEACNAFYTRIPHDFGMHVPDKITTLEQLQKKMQLLEALDDIEVAVNIIKKTNTESNPIDQQYISLKCELNPLEKAHPNYKMVEKYLLTNVGGTHAHYKLQLLDVMECQKSSELQPKLHNRMLLWHGSRLTNWAGILATGLRIAPPEAPVTGYMFGKGLYFADCSTKSANYCFTDRTNNTGLMVLCEVGLGEPNELSASKYNANLLPKGKHSTKGCGRYVPKSSTHVTMDDGVVVPIGKVEDGAVSGLSLLYNEYIVYNTAQVRMRYLLKVKFNYN